MPRRRLFGSLCGRTINTPWNPASRIPCARSSTLASLNDRTYAVGLAPRYQVEPCSQRHGSVHWICQILMYRLEVIPMASRLYRTTRPLYLAVEQVLWQLQVPLLGSPTLAALIALSVTGLILLSARPTP